MKDPIPIDMLHQYIGLTRHLQELGMEIFQIVQLQKE